MSLSTVVGLVGDISGKPTQPTQGSALIQSFLNWTLWLGVMLSGIAAVAGFGIMGVATLGGQINHSNRGKSVALVGLAGAAGCGVAIPLINLFFSAAGK